MSTTANSQNSKMVRVHVWIAGRVQGVGYRFSTLTEARQQGINGWVIITGRTLVLQGIEWLPNNLERVRIEVMNKLLQQRWLSRWS